MWFKFWNNDPWLFQKQHFCQAIISLPHLQLIPNVQYVVPRKANTKCWSRNMYNLCNFAMPTEFQGLWNFFFSIYRNDINQNKGICKITFTEWSRHESRLLYVCLLRVDMKLPWMMVKYRGMKPLHENTWQQNLQINQSESSLPEPCDTYRWNIFLSYLEHFKWENVKEWLVSTLHLISE